MPIALAAKVTGAEPVAAPAPEESDALAPELQKQLRKRFDND
jgi:hypothetical protein